MNQKYGVGDRLRIVIEATVIGTETTGLLRIDTGERYKPLFNPKDAKSIEVIIPPAAEVFAAMPIGTRFEVYANRTSDTAISRSCAMKVSEDSYIWTADVGMPKIGVYRADFFPMGYRLEVIK